jgi:pseudouridine synthase
MKYIVKEEDAARINVFLAKHGIASRRQADALVSSGKIIINGKHAKLGDRVKKGDAVHIHEEKKAYKYVMYYKPRGEVTGPIAKHPGLLPIGRLDKESEGLLLYTNDYRVTDALLHPRHEHEREYLVTVREQMTPRVERLLMQGISTQETTYKKARKVKIHENKHILNVILTEGKKHEIRRMLNALNLTILSLKRTRILMLTLGTLKAGAARELTASEQAAFLKALKLV